MIRFFISLLSVLFVSTSMAQSYLGHITKPANLRVSSDVSSEKIMTLPAQSILFIVSQVGENGFYNVIDVRTNKEGYIHKTLVELDEIIKPNTGGLFIPTGKIKQTNPSVSIYNNTNREMTLRLNSDVYVFNSQEKKTLILNPTTYKYRASAPGVIPNIGEESLNSNMGYNWEFYIITTYR